MKRARPAPLLLAEKPGRYSDFRARLLGVWPSLMRKSVWCPGFSAARSTLGPLLLTAVSAFGAYTYYYTDTLTTINTNNWYVNGSVTATSNGLTAPTTNGGSLISKSPCPTAPATTRSRAPSGSPPPAAPTINTSTPPATPGPPAPEALFTYLFTGLRTP